MDDTMQAKPIKCCVVATMCGRSLLEGVVFIAVSTLVTSLIALLLSLVNVGQMTYSNLLYNGQPPLAVNLIFALVATCISVYQIVISMLLLWQAVKTKGNIFLCVLWYVSHLAILTMYFLLLSAKAVISFRAKQFFNGFVTIVVGIAYEGTFIYFAIIVNSYIQSLDNVRYF